MTVSTVEPNRPPVPMPMPGPVPPDEPARPPEPPRPPDPYRVPERMPEPEPERPAGEVPGGPGPVPGPGPGPGQVPGPRAEAVPAPAGPGSADPAWTTAVELADAARFVFDPDVPPHDRGRIARVPAERLPAPDADPKRWPDWAPERLDSIPLMYPRTIGFGIATLLGLLIALILLAVGSVPAGLVLLAAAGGLGYGAWRAVGAEWDVIDTERFAAASEEHRHLIGWRAAIAHRERLLDLRDLDDAGRDLVARTRRAARAILASEAQRVGVVDSDRNRVELFHQLWRIGGDVRGLAELAANVAETRRHVVSEEGGAVLANREAKIDGARASVTARVVRIETYAESIADLDRRLGEVRALENLRPADSFADVLARIDANEADAAQISSLETSALAALRTSIATARETAFWSD